MLISLVNNAELIYREACTTPLFQDGCLAEQAKDNTARRGPEQSSAERLAI